MRLRYRLWQIWQDVTVKAPLPPEARQEIGGVLSVAELRLFDRYGPRDQQHAYLVYQTLLAAGHTSRPLLAAALLHDVGKARVRLRAWDRMLPVLVETVWPSLARRWGAGAPEGWRRGFAVRRQHPAWGAEMARAAGSDALTVDLICRHQIPPYQTTPEDHLLLLLQWADDRS